MVGRLTEEKDKQQQTGETMREYLAEGKKDSQEGKLLP